MTNRAGTARSPPGCLFHSWPFCDDADASRGTFGTGFQLDVRQMGHIRRGARFAGVRAALTSLTAVSAGSIRSPVRAAHFVRGRGFPTSPRVTLDGRPGESRGTDRARRRPSLQHLRRQRRQCGRERNARSWSNVFGTEKRSNGVTEQKQFVLRSSVSPCERRSYERSPLPPPARLSPGSYFFFTI
jgi:hypothetical protein